MKFCEVTTWNFVKQNDPLTDRRVARPFWKMVVSLTTRARLPERNGLVNEVEFLGLISQKR